MRSSRTRPPSSESFQICSQYNSSVTNCVFFKLGRKKKKHFDVLFVGILHRWILLQPRRPLVSGMPESWVYPELVSDSEGGGGKGYGTASDEVVEFQSAHGGTSEEGGYEVDSAGYADSLGGLVYRSTSERAASDEDEKGKSTFSNLRSGVTILTREEQERERMQAR